MTKTIRIPIYGHDAAVFSGYEDYVENGQIGLFWRSA